MTHQLIKYEAAVKALAEAYQVDEVKIIHDKAKALEVYAKQAKDKRLLVMACEIKLRAERRAGELLIEMKKQGELKGGQRTDLKNNNANRLDSNEAVNLVDSNDQVETKTTLNDLGISKDQSSDWQKLAQVEPENFNEFLKEALDEGDVITAHKLLDVVKAKMDEGKLPPEERKKAREEGKIVSERIKRAVAIQEALETFATFDMQPEKAIESNLFIHTEYVVDQYLDDALIWVNDFAEHWRKIRC